MKYRARKKSHPVYVWGKFAVIHHITKSFTRTNKPKFEQAKKKLEFSALILVHLDFAVKYDNFT